MPFVTTLSLASGDRAALDGVVEEIRERASRKGIEFKGPHTHPPKTYQVPQRRRLADGDGEFDPWAYTVYERTIEIAGHDQNVRDVADWEFPPAVRVELEIDRVRSVGSG